MSIKAYAKHDKVILKPIEVNEEYVGSIVVPDNGREKANLYEVVDIGPGVYNSLTGVITPTQYKVGERVFVHKVHLHALEIDDQEVYVVREIEILCGVKEVDEDFEALLNGITEDGQ
jgi:chaperonin GroES